MSNHYLSIEKSGPLHGSVALRGAKNAVLAIMASLILTKGTSKITNVPYSSDVIQMIDLLRDLGAHIDFDLLSHTLLIDTTYLANHKVQPEIMGKMRASILVTGPLLARFGCADVALPGGCVIGARPIDFHIKSFKELGVLLEREGPFLKAYLPKGTPKAVDRRIVFEYPSVGATENILMFAATLPGKTTMVNAALEPEVFDLISVLNTMGADISYGSGAILHVKGVGSLRSIEHEAMPDRLEAGALLLAAAMTGGDISISNAQPEYMDLFLEKLKHMGHAIIIKKEVPGIYFKATNQPQAVSFKTGPYPSFPTDLQAPMMAAQCIANGISVIEETVFENRLMHVKELQKMGAQIDVEGRKALIRGVDELYGAEVIASDIRASCALVLAGLVANGSTKVIGVHHWQRAYERLEDRISVLGGRIKLHVDSSMRSRSEMGFYS